MRFLEERQNQNAFTVASLAPANVLRSVHRQDADNRVTRRAAATRSWNERDHEIRRTLRSLRSGLDMVMENLDSVRRQIDNDVGRRFDLNLLDPDLISGRRGVADNYSEAFHENYRDKCPNVRKIYAQQRPRLSHYILEPNVGRGFIKELCFSSDGRLICSPYKQGLRLLAFDDNCSEMSHCVSPTGKTQLLNQVGYLSDCHNRSVVSTKFSPTQTLLVSGCLDGKITWHQPVL